MSLVSSVYFFFLAYVALFVVFMVLLAVVFLPPHESSTTSMIDNNTFVKLMRTFLKNPLQTSNLPPTKIGVPIYFINLDRSTDRLANMQQEFKTLPDHPDIHRVTAIDGLNLSSLSSLQQQNSQGSLKYINTDLTISTSQLACTLSHLKAIKAAYDQNSSDTVMIVEDDAMFGLQAYWPKSIPEIITDLTIFDPLWHMLLLFSTKINYKSSEPQKQTPVFLPTEEYSGTVAYLLNRRGMKTILDQVYDPVDNTFHLDGNVIADSFLYKTSGHAYSYYKPLIYTADIQSTIMANENSRNFANRWSSKILKEYIDDILARDSML